MKQAWDRTYRKREDTHLWKANNFVTTERRMGITSSSYSRELMLKSRLGNRIFWPSFSERFLRFSKQIPEEYNQTDHHSLLSSSFVVSVYFNAVYSELTALLNKFP
jgi:hypothetical protein